MSTNDSLPYEHANIGVATVNIATREGFTEGFGTVRIRAGEGKSLAIEIVEDLTGTTIVAVLDEFRGIRSRVDLQSDHLVAAVQQAATDNGMPLSVSPTPH